MFASQDLRYECYQYRFSHLIIGNKQQVIQRRLEEF